MANVIDDTENALTLAIGALVIFALVWVLWQFRGLFAGLGGLLNGTADPGTLQSVKNALAGFPNGADPGTVPAAQYLQGMAESNRNFGNYVFGSDTWNQYSSQDEVPAVPSAPTPEQTQMIDAAMSNLDQNLQQINLGSDPVSWLQRNKIF
jgi:hypothetical protein